VTAPLLKSEPDIWIIASCEATPVRYNCAKLMTCSGLPYRYAVGRGFATLSPLPTDTPRPPTQWTPYIYTVDELKRLLAATEILQTPLQPLPALTMRTLFLLLYGTGMRIGEAISLTLRDVDLENRVLMVRDSKFFKTRLVPIGPRLTTVLTDYLHGRCQLPLLAGEASAFLATRTGIRRSAWHSHNPASQGRQPTPGELIGEGARPVFGRDKLS
jgi:site-specific recombinase XerD